MQRIFHLKIPLTMKPDYCNRYTLNINPGEKLQTSIIGFPLNFIWLFITVIGGDNIIYNSSILKEGEKKKECSNG